MKIVKLQIKNFLSIADAQLEPGGKVTQIVGLNNQGKTTILKALEVAFGGSSDGSLVKHGETEAEIIVEFDDKMILNRKIKATGKDTVTLKRDGLKFEKPQTVLNSLFDSSNFNPLELLDPRKRTEAILKTINVKVTEQTLRERLKDCPVPLPPLNYDQHGLNIVDDAYKYFYQRRAEANKIAKDKKSKYEVEKANLEAQQDSLKIPSKEDCLWLIEASKEKIKNLQHQKTLRDTAQVQADHARDLLNSAEQRRESMIRQMEKLKEQLLAADEVCKEQAKHLVKISEKVSEHKFDQADVDAMHEQINKQHEFLKIHSEREVQQVKLARVTEYYEEAANAIVFSNKLNSAVATLGPEFKSELLKGADLPMPGLTYFDGHFFLEGSSIDNLSSSKALKLAVNVAKKLAAKTKIICIDGAEQLDVDNYDALRKEIEGDEFTYFMTKVGDAFPSATDKVVTMEAGRVH